MTAKAKPTSGEHPESYDAKKGPRFSGETSKLPVALTPDSMQPHPPAHVERHKPSKATRHDPRTAKATYPDA